MSSVRFQINPETIQKILKQHGNNRSAAKALKMCERTWHDWTKRGFSRSCARDRAEAYLRQFIPEGQ